MNACNANAQQGQNAPPAPPPHVRSASGQPGPAATSTPNVKATSITHDIKANVASTSGSEVPPRGGVPPAHNNHNPQHHQPKDVSTSISPAAAPPRLQPAAQAYARPPPQEERRVSFAPQPVASTSAATSTTKPALPPPPAAVEVDELDIPDDSSEFLFNSDDDAFFALVALGEEGLGGPINFDVGAGGVEGSDESNADVRDSRQVGGPPPQNWGHPPQAQQPADPRVARPPQPPYRHAGTSSNSSAASSSTSHKPQSTSSVSHTAYQSSRDRDASSAPLAQSPRAMGGFHYPSANSVRYPRPPSFS